MIKSKNDEKIEQFKIDNKVIANSEKWVMSLQLTATLIRLLTVGGTPFDAIQKYAPLWWRFACRSTKVDPLIVNTINKQKEKWFISFVSIEMLHLQTKLILKTVIWLRTKNNKKKLKNGRSKNKPKKI